MEVVWRPEKWRPEKGSDGDHGHAGRPKEEFSPFHGDLPAPPRNDGRCGIGQEKLHTNEGADEEAAGADARGWLITDSERGWEAWAVCDGFISGCARAW